jgi:hypothetical protein
LHKPLAEECGANGTLWGQLYKFGTHECIVIWIQMLISYRAFHNEETEVQPLEHQHYKLGREEDTAKLTEGGLRGRKTIKILMATSHMTFSRGQN